MNISKKQLSNIKKKIKKHPYRFVALCGFATFFFGFGAAALLNWYLIVTHNPFIEHLRSSLNYKSAIFGDGIVLPVVNMLVAWFLFTNSKLITKQLVQGALLCGGAITIYFHVTQAMQGLVNWAMPTPWHWNILGLWHACYMLSVTSFLSLFYLVVISYMISYKRFPKNAFAVSFGIILFFMLLKLDYQTVNVPKAFAADVSQTKTHLTTLIQSGDARIQDLR